jgi:hypothetical protein
MDLRLVGELLDYLLSFAPWIGYVILTRAANSWADGYTLGLGLAFALVVWRTIRRDSRFLDIGTLCFCAVMTAVSVSYPNSPLRPYNLPLSMAAVAALSAASLVMRSPFTFRIARRHVGDEVLDDPNRFQALYRAHVAATSWWAGSQIVGAVASALCVAARSLALASVFQGVGTLVPVGMTRYHHARGTRPLDQPGPVSQSATSESATSESGPSEPDSSGSGDAGEPSAAPPGTDGRESLGELGELPS